MDSYRQLAKVLR